MGGLSIGVHPLFFIFGIYNAITGQIFSFVIYTVTAIIHELGHSLVAHGAGYKLNKITLMPYGAVVSGDIEGLNLLDQVKIALAGPLINISVALFFVASWWVFPITYAYTDIVVSANFSMAIINLLPVFPLDGGRVLWSSIALKYDSEKARKICVTTGIFTAILLFSLFIFALAKSVMNVSLLFFSLFVLFGVIGKTKENKYVKIYSGINTERLKYGVDYKRKAVDKSVTIKKLITLLDGYCINEIAVFDKGKQVALLSQNRINRIIEQGDIYSPIEKYL